MCSEGGGRSEDGGSFNDNYAVFDNTNMTKFYNKFNWSGEDVISRKYYTYPWFALKHDSAKTWQWLYSFLKVIKIDFGTVCWIQTNFRT